MQRYGLEGLARNGALEEKPDADEDDEREGDDEEALVAAADRAELEEVLQRLLLADVDDAALPVSLVDAHHHAVRIEAGALALGEAVLHALRPHDALIAHRLHRRADLLLVGRARLLDRRRDHHDA